MRLQNRLQKIYLLVAIVFLGISAAQASVEAVEAPDAMVKQVTSKLLKDIVNYRDAIDEAKAELEQEALLSQFYDELQATLDPVIDFRLISRRVMGEYFKTATPEQFERFETVFARSLVETYGRGLLAYSSDQEVQVEPLSDSDREKSKVVVVQKIQTAERAIPLYYSLWRNKRGEWKVVNLILDGINMGKTFHGQFAESARKYGGDVEQVIENWSTAES